MKLKINKSKRYHGYQIGIHQDEEALTVEGPDGAVIAKLVLEDFLDRLVSTAHGFKRKYPRLGLGVHVKYFDEHGQLCEGIASTIGGGGLFIEQLSPLPPGTETSLEFSLPASQNQIRARAKVVWVRQQFIQQIHYPGMGLQFVQISDRDRAELIHFVNTFIYQRGFREFPG